MKTYTSGELEKILAKHEAWLNNEKGGERADLSYADLCRTNLRQAKLSRADLRYANLCGANLRGALLSYANLSGANLRAADLYGVSLCRTDLRRAKLWADLSYADLRGADLRDANLRGALLSYADLRGANMSGADLRRTYLLGTNLSNANLTSHVFFGGASMAPIYQACCCYGPANDTVTLLAQGEPSEWMFFTGCFRGTRAELEKAVHEKHGGTKEEANYMRAIEYLVETALANA